MGGSVADGRSQLPGQVLGAALQVATSRGHALAHRGAVATPRGGSGGGAGERPGGPWSARCRSRRFSDSKADLAARARACQRFNGR